jgi:hypothetical protein
MGGWGDEGVEIFRILAERQWNQGIQASLSDFLRSNLKLAQTLHVNVQTREDRVQYAQLKEI